MYEKFRYHTRETGLSIISLLILIAMLGVFVLAVSKVADPWSWYQKMLDNKRKADLALISKKVEAYYDSHGRYPRSSGPGLHICDDYSFLIKDYVVAKDTVAAMPWGSEWRNYMKKLPKDPDQKKCYAYYATPDGQAYWLYASLDREGKDKAACNKGYACRNLEASAMSNTQCGGICNYGISSDNVSP